MQRFAIAVDGAASIDLNILRIKFCGYPPGRRTAHGIFEPVLFIVLRLPSTHESSTRLHIQSGVALQHQIADIIRSRRHIYDALFPIAKRSAITARIIDRLLDRSGTLADSIRLAGYRYSVRSFRNIEDPFTRGWRNIGFHRICRDNHPTCPVIHHDNEILRIVRCERNRRSFHLVCLDAQLQRTDRIFMHLVCILDGKFIRCSEMKLEAGRISCKISGYLPFIFVSPHLDLTQHYE